MLKASNAVVCNQFYNNCVIKLYYIHYIRVYLLQYCSRKRHLTINYLLFRNRNSEIVLILWANVSLLQILVLADIQEKMNHIDMFCLISH